MDNDTGLAQDNPESTLKTSITDNGEYPEFCELASQDESLFSNFRRHQIYTRVLEHDSPEQGIQYLASAKKLKKFSDWIEEFKNNDRIGNPVQCEFDGIGLIATPTIRYIKILSDLEAEFGSLDNFNICEIGVGYGGLCRIINSYFKIQSYCLVDLSGPLKIARKYLEHFQINAPIAYKTMEDLNGKDKYDLLISNYAFTELRREIQDIYLEKIIHNSERGYITYNYINPPSFNSYTKEELSQIIKNLKITKEIELTHPQDCILTWWR